MITAIYKKQVELLLKILPYVVREDCRALKGGTAINMFIFDLPRLSVDLDLTYIHFDHRELALSNIAASIIRMKERIGKAIPSIKIETKTSIENQEEKLICWHGGVQVKIEINTIMRGIIRPTRLLPVTKKVQEEFNLFAEMNVVSDAELFGGKICAALDRQHPRDLFDIHYLLTTIGFTEEIKLGFVAALLSHPRSIHEMLKPNFHNQELAFNNKFLGMANIEFSYPDFENTCQNLVKVIKEKLTEQDRNFLLSFKSATPKWELINIEKLADLPAVKWKLLNIQKLKMVNPDKHIDFLKKLQVCLDM